MIYFRPFTSLPSEMSMKLPKLSGIIVLSMGLCLFVCPALAQVVEIKGAVYDGTQQYAMQGVSVVSTSGIGVKTDSAGRYKLMVPLSDSIVFSYLGRGTAKYPVKDMPRGYPFDVSLQITMDTLPEALVRSPNYRADSMANRKEYEKAFNYSKAPMHNMKLERRAGFGIGLDLDALLNPKANREMQTLQDRLIWEEQDKYIEHRWNKAVVRRVTGLEPPALDTFMRQYRPSYDFIESCKTEYEFYKYIQEWGKFFDEDWRVAHNGKAPPGVAGSGDANAENPKKDQ
jgi:hypothetical protein